MGALIPGETRDPDMGLYKGLCGICGTQIWEEDVRWKLHSKDPYICGDCMDNLPTMCVSCADYLNCPTAYDTSGCE